MPGFVPDASATLPWRFEDEATPWGVHAAPVPLRVGLEWQLRQSPLDIPCV